MTNSTIIVDLRPAIKNRATTAEVYTGYNEIPDVVGAELHYVKTAGGFITLGFLVDGTDYASLAKSFVVYTTNAHYYATDANGSKWYTLPVITGGKLDTITLSETQYTDVCKLGIGIYTYAANGYTLTYKSFDQNWKPVTWYDGTIVVDGKMGYTYGENVHK